MGTEELLDLQDAVGELLDLQGVVEEITALVPVEVLPVEPLPVQAVSWLTRLLTIFSRHAYLLAFFGALIENTVLLGFLLPGGSVVAFAAVGGRMAGLSLPLLMLLGAAGMTGGAVIDYLLGRSGADRLLYHRWAGRFGRRLAQQLDEAAPLLRRHGWWMMLLAHTFGHGRSAMAVAAGASHLSLRRFLGIEIPAALLWSALYTGGGYLLAGEIHTFELALRRAGWVGAALMVAGWVAWWYVGRRRRRRGTAAGSAVAARPDPAAADTAAEAAPVAAGERETVAANSLRAATPAYGSGETPSRSLRETATEPNPP
jgi:membrane protein DedA with SNARE-associated domain